MTKYVKFATDQCTIMREPRIDHNWVNSLDAQHQIACVGNLLVHLNSEALCPMEEQLDLSLPIADEEPFKMQKFECAMGECEHCFIEDSLPWNCKDFGENEDAVRCWEWKKLSEDANRRFPVKVDVKVEHVIRELKTKYIEYTKHGFHGRWQK